MSETTRAHMVSVTKPGLPDENTVVLDPFSGLFEYRTEQVCTPVERSQYAPNVDIWEYSIPRVIHVEVELEALVSAPTFRINPGLYFGLELWSEMHDDTAGTTAWGVLRLHKCKLRGFEFGIWQMEATPVGETPEIYRAWVQHDTNNENAKEDS